MIDEIRDVDVKTSVPVLKKLTM